MQRKPYYPRPKENRISTRNEPFFLREKIPEYVIRYPDMYSAYQMFSEKTHIPVKNFILCNGAENAFRAAVLCLANPLYQMEVAIETPGWGMAQVICESLHIPWKEYAYHIVRGSKTFRTEPVKTDVLYTTDSINNNIFHEEPEGEYSYRILDETYTLQNLVYGNYQNDGRTITIGSFSKWLGAGTRLGYAIFPDCFADEMQLLREQYISPEAVQELDMHFDDLMYDVLSFSLEIFLKKAGYWTSKIIEEKGIIPYKAWAWHPTYITVQAESLPFPHKHFMIDGVPFCRFGRPAHTRTLKELFRKEGRTHE